MYDQEIVTELVLDEEINKKHISDLETQKTVYANKIEIKEMSFKN